MADAFSGSGLTRGSGTTGGRGSEETATLRASGGGGEEAVVVRGTELSSTTSRAVCAAVTPGLLLRCSCVATRWLFCSDALLPELWQQGGSRRESCQSPVRAHCAQGNPCLSASCLICTRPPAVKLNVSSGATNRAASTKRRRRGPTRRWPSCRGGPAGDERSMEAATPAISASWRTPGSVRGFPERSKTHPGVTSRSRKGKPRSRGACVGLVVIADGAVWIALRAQATLFLSVAQWALGLALTALLASPRLRETQQQRSGVVREVTQQARRVSPARPPAAGALAGACHQT